ncbi:Zinc resistance conferring protein [Bonamia ostreae]|uniref:Zinc resistance conferring protein n=1 Tax=Bonamia ostreae TaxID=126728 RepID=A0ABV2AJD1_9EUKA
MLILIISFFFVELIFGALYDFLVLVADAMHMLTDAIALVIGLYAFIKSKKVRTDKATFGFVRMEVVGGLVNGCFLMVIAFDIFREAITLLLKNEVNKDLVENSGVLLIIGGIGLGVNIIGLIVFGFDHGHGHSDDNSEKKKNFNIQAVFLHVLGDALGSVAVIVSCLVIRYSTWERRTIIDPICSMIISVIIFATSIPVVRGTVRVLLEKVPTTVDLYLLKRKLLAIDGIKNIHELHVWQLNSNKTLATCHVILDKSKNFKRLNDDIQKVFHGCGVHSTTIQPEFQSGSKDCFDIVCGSTRCIEELCCEKIESDD